MRRLWTVLVLLSLPLLPCIYLVRSRPTREPRPPLPEARPEKLEAEAAEPVSGGTETKTPLPTPEADKQWRAIGDLLRRPGGRPLDRSQMFPGSSRTTLPPHSLRGRFQEARARAIREKELRGEALPSGDYEILRAPEGKLIVALRIEEGPLFRALADAHAEDLSSEFRAVAQVASGTEGELGPNTFLQDPDPAARAAAENLRARREEVIERRRREGRFEDPDTVVRHEGDGRLIVIRRGEFPDLDALKDELQRPGRAQE